MPDKDAIGAWQDGIATRGRCLAGTHHGGKRRVVGQRRQGGHGARRGRRFLRHRREVGHQHAFGLAGRARGGCGLLGAWRRALHRAGFVTRRRQLRGRCLDGRRDQVADIARDGQQGHGHGQAVLEAQGGDFPARFLCFALWPARQLGGRRGGVLGLGRHPEQLGGDLRGGLGGVGGLEPAGRDQHQQQRGRVQREHALARAWHDGGRHVLQRGADQAAQVGAAERLGQGGGGQDIVCAEAGDVHHGLARIGRAEHGPGLVLVGQARLQLKLDARAAEHVDDAVELCLVLLCPVARRCAAPEGENRGEHGVQGAGVAASSPNRIAWVTGS